jgi:hypothetical protein
MKLIIYASLFALIVGCGSEPETAKKTAWINSKDKISIEETIRKEWGGKKFSEFVKVFGQGTFGNFTKTYKYYSIARIPNPDVPNKHLFYDVELSVNPDTRVIIGGAPTYERTKAEFRDLNNELEE